MQFFNPSEQENRFRLNNKITLSDSGNIVITCQSAKEAKNLRKMLLFYKRTQSYEGGQIAIDIELSKDNASILILGGNKNNLFEMLAGLELISQEKVNTLKDIQPKGEELKNDIDFLFSNLTDNTDKEMLKKTLENFLKEISLHTERKLDDKDPSFLVRAK